MRSSSAHVCRGSSARKVSDATVGCCAGKIKGAKEADLEKQRDIRLKIRQEAQTALKATIKSHRADKLVRVPPVKNCMTVCDILLALKMLPEWVKDWALESYHSDIDGVAECKVLHAQEYWPFARTCGVGHLLLRYRDD